MRLKCKPQYALTRALNRTTIRRNGKFTNVVEGYSLEVIMNGLVFLGVQPDEAQRISELYFNKGTIRKRWSSVLKYIQGER